MARSFRLYGKKRGHRRTGSPVIGSVGEALFFALFLLLGCGGLIAIFATLVVPEWRVNHVFVQHPCTVLAKQVGQIKGEDGTLYRPEIQIEYQISGETYRVWTYDIRHAYSAGKQDKQKILEDFAVGQLCACWYNPADPSQAVLVRGYNWWLWLTFIVPVSFILIGGGGLIYTALGWGKSAERRAALAKRTAELDLFDMTGQAKSDYPHIPVDSNITNSPGTTLAFRLPTDVSSAWALFATLTACILWNGIIAGFAAAAAHSHLEGRPDWFLTFFVIPFLVIGIGLILFFLRQLVLATGIGPTLLEISDHPIHPGRSYRFLLSQAGRLKLNSLELLLVCEEEATYRQGTDTRTEACRVFQESVFRRENFEVRPGVPFEVECEWVMPSGVMHSFTSEHNEVNWRLIVKGDAKGWPGFERSFPVIVYPGTCANGTAVWKPRIPATESAGRESQ